MFKSEGNSFNNDLSEVIGNFRNTTEWKRRKEDKQIITEIVRHLVQNDNYTVYGYWLCRKQEHESKIQFTREFLDEFLKRPEELYDFFMNQCEKCHKNHLIMSFLLYTPNNSSRIPTIEVIRHLEWNNLYRVFGNWKCLHCKKKWESAYTWISLEKFLAQTPGNHLSSADFCMQKCKTCVEGDVNIIISSYKALEQSDDGTIHKRLLCAKCQAGAICVQTDTYLGYRK